MLLLGSMILPDLDMSAKDDEKFRFSLESHGLEPSRTGNQYELEDEGLPYNKLLFPYKLRQLLDDAEQSGQEGVVSWLVHGQAFKVHKPKEFTDGIMRKHFRQTQFKSFTRQLYHYGFGKVDSGVDRGAFYHPQFQRDDPSLCLSIVRRKSKGKKILRKLSVGTCVGDNYVREGEQREMLSTSFQALVGQRHFDRLESVLTPQNMDETGKFLGLTFPRGTRESTQHGIASNDNTMLVPHAGRSVSNHDWLSSLEAFFCLPAPSNARSGPINPTPAENLRAYEPRPIEEMLSRNRAL